jgi:hypothetical protein
MSTIHRSRSLVFGIATMFALTLLAPVGGAAEEEVAALAPVAAPAVASTSSDDVRAARALAAQHALQSGDIGSLQEDRLLAIVAAAPGWDETSGYRSVEASRAAASALLAPVAAPSWDETSGYRSVEASRATIGHPAASTSASTTQVPADVRWAPAGSAWLAASRAAAARRAAPDVPEWDAVRWSPVEPGPATNSDYIPAALASGQRVESAHLAAVSLPGEAVSVNPSDDRIAAALFGDELSR